MTRNIGLARALSKMGLCSRSEAFRLIRAGKVKLNGRVCRDPESPTREGNDRIELSGASVKKQPHQYWMMNKPRGIVTTAKDERGRTTVKDLLPAGLPHLGVVGRLDKASEGLLLLTNDSEWAAAITSPSSLCRKTYHVQIGRAADHDLL